MHNDAVKKDIRDSDENTTRKLKQRMRNMEMRKAHYENTTAIWSDNLASEARASVALSRASTKLRNKGLEQEASKWSEEIVGLAKQPLRDSMDEE